MSNDNLIPGNDPAKPVEDGAASDTVSSVTSKDILTGTEDVAFNAGPHASADGSAHDAVLGGGQGVEALTVSDLLTDSGANIDNLGAFLKFDTTSSPGNTIVSVGLDDGGGSTTIPLVTVHGEMTLAQLLNGGQIDYTP